MSSYKKVDRIFTLTLNGKDIVVLGDYYDGSPLICWKYDILIGPKDIIAKYKKEIFFSKKPDDGWNPKVIKI
jgi:hypothetical protein